VWGIHPPLLFDGERLGRVSPPPTLGEHTKEVIDELEREDGAARGTKSAV
jgi:crotonobetainyl-CoA:carnitine CoA-transferase CaiB-like acyl-CoA transferase